MSQIIPANSRAMRRKIRVTCRIASGEKRAPYRVLRPRKGKPASGAASGPLQERLDFGEGKRKPRAVRAKAKVPTEMQIHAGYVQWVRLAEKQWPALRLGYHCPNGEARDKPAALKLQRMGVRPGVPDWMLPVARGGYHGLALEFKRPGGQLSDEQAEFIAALLAEGWACYVLTDRGQAVKLTVAYLKGEIMREFWLEK